MAWEFKEAVARAIEPIAGTAVHFCRDVTCGDPGLSLGKNPGFRRERGRTIPGRVDPLEAGEQRLAVGLDPASFASQRAVGDDLRWDRLGHSQLAAYRQRNQKFFSGLVWGVSDPREGSKILIFLFPPRLVCCSLLHLRSAWKKGSPKFGDELLRISDNARRRAAAPNPAKAPMG